MSNPDWNLARAELMRAFARLGYPEEFAGEVARNLASPKSMRRMAAYLGKARSLSVEMIVDEMFAIMEERQKWIEKKQSQEANEALTAWMNRDLEL